MGKDSKETVDFNILIIGDLLHLRRMNSTIDQWRSADTESLGLNSPGACRYAVRSNGKPEFVLGWSFPRALDQLRLGRLTLKEPRFMLHLPEVAPDEARLSLGQAVQGCLDLLETGIFVVHEHRPELDTDVLEKKRQEEQQEWLQSFLTAGRLLERDDQALTISQDGEITETLDFLSAQLPLCSDDRRQWKWVVIAAHHAVQAGLLRTVRGTDTEAMLTQTGRVRGFQSMMKGEPFVTGLTGDQRRTLYRLDSIRGEMAHFAGDHLTIGISFLANLVSETISLMPAILKCTHSQFSILELLETVEGQQLKIRSEIDRIIKVNSYG